jgi:hypothetical protein
MRKRDGHEAEGRAAGDHLFDGNAHGAAHDEEVVNKADGKQDSQAYEEDAAPAIGAIPVRIIMKKSTVMKSAVIAAAMMRQPDPRARRDERT